MEQSSTKLTAAEELRRFQLQTNLAKARALQHEAERYRWSVGLATAATAAATSTSSSAASAAASASASASAALSSAAASELERRVKEEETELAESIQKAHTSFAAGNVSDRAAKAGHETTYGVVLLNRIRRYEAEIETLLAHPSEFVLKTEDEVANLTLRETQEDIRQLHAVFERMETQTEELRAALQREQTTQEQQAMLKSALETRLDAAEAGELEPSQSSSEVRARTKVIAESNRKLMASMASFMSKYFPPPSPDDDESDATASTSASKKAAGKQKEPQRQPKGAITQFFARDRPALRSLNDLLEDLMNKCMTSPHDPYITLDDSHWPPYIELIVRSGIGMRHPHIPRKLKLTDFHQ